MSRLPPNTNHLCRCSLASVWFLGLYGLLELIPGLIHFFLPDGGAGVIAGLDLAANKHTIIGVFAWMGALQIAYGLGILAVADWVTKPSPTGHHPPEHYASLLLVPVLAVFLAMAVRSRSGAVD